MHERAFIPGLNRQLEKGLDQRSCPGIEMWLWGNFLYWKYENRSGVLPAVQFQSIVFEEGTEIAVEPKVKKSKEQTLHA